RRHTRCLSDWSSDVCSSDLGESPVMKQIFFDAKRIAKSNANVLITGESGTGKEVVAQLIHCHSNRQDKPSIKVNCAAVPETLIRSEERRVGKECRCGL